MRLWLPVVVMVVSVLVSGCCGLCDTSGSSSGSRGGDAAAPSRAPVASTPPRASSSGAARTGGKVPMIAAKTLIDAYNTDEKAAHKRYGDRRIRTEGWIAELNEGIFANPTIGIGSSRSTDVLYDVMVQCRVTDDLVDEVERLVVGSKIVVEGDLEGKQLGQIHLEECEIVTKTKP